MRWSTSGPATVSSKTWTCAGDAPASNSAVAAACSATALRRASPSPDGNVPPAAATRSRACWISACSFARPSAARLVAGRTTAVWPAVPATSRARSSRGSTKPVYDVTTLGAGYRVATAAERSAPSPSRRASATA